jgi:uncharacterized glyoxalase superfamily protein PhnB
MKEYGFFGVSPVFKVSSVEDAVKYYVEKLGFELGFLHGEPPTYGQVNLGKLESGYIPITLQFSKSGETKPSEDYHYITVGTKIHQLFENFKHKGVKIINEIQDYPYGMTEFTILDLNGKKLVFGGHTEDQ